MSTTHKMAVRGRAVSAPPAPRSGKLWWIPGTPSCWRCRGRPAPRSPTGPRTPANWRRHATARSRQSAARRAYGWRSRDHRPPIACCASSIATPGGHVITNWEERDFYETLVSSPCLIAGSAISRIWYNELEWHDVRNTMCCNFFYHSDNLRAGYLCSRRIFNGAFEIKVAFTCDQTQAQWRRTNYDFAYLLQSI